MPKEAGEYTARAVFPANDTYAQVIATDDFSITYLPVPENPYTVSGVQGENGYYTSEAIVTAAAGYLVSLSQDGNYVEYLVISTSQPASNLFFMKQATGEKTAAVGIEAFKIDTEAPQINAEDNKLYYGDSIQISVSDKNLEKVLVNGKEISFKDSIAKFKLKSNGGIEEYEISFTDLAGNTRTIKISVASEWTKSGIVPDGLLIKLVAANAYKLGSGNWQVNGDATTYTGNQTFYIGNEGQYSFTKQ